MPNGDWDLVTNAAGAGALGLLGRMLAYAHADRRPIGWSLLWELPVALGMGVIGKGVADWATLDGFLEYGLTIAVAYVGPRFVDLVVARVQERIASR